MHIFLIERIDLSSPVSSFEEYMVSEFQVQREENVQRLNYTFPVGSFVNRNV